MHLKLRSVYTVNQLAFNFSWQPACNNCLVYTDLSEMDLDKFVDFLNMGHKPDVWEY